jgi:hypothetical protein
VVRSPDRRYRLFCSQNFPHRLWGPPSLLLRGYRGFFAGVKRLAVQLTLHLHFFFFFFFFFFVIIIII